MGLDNRDYARKLDHPWYRVRAVGSKTQPVASKSTLGPAAVSLAALGLLVFTADALVANAVGLNDLAAPPGQVPLRPLCAWACASVGLICTDFQAWRLLTFPLAQEHLLPLFVNAAAIVVCGSFIELAYGLRRFAAISALSAVAGLLACAGVSLLVGSPGIWTPIGGTPAIALGLTASTVLASPRDGYFSLLGLDVRVHSLAGLLFALTIGAMLLTSASPGVAAGQLAGVAGALLVVANPRRAGLQPESTEAMPPLHGPDQELDRILAKISSTGMDSLTEVEKQTLAEATRRRAQS